ncbi:cytochrome P450 [Streptomyces sp. NPDC056656]|uniref:cytochrome P450 n=1 Tax=Streptomyces sp. NPDC056656 TaxID=3345895 RepID=UPI003687367E
MADYIQPLAVETTLGVLGVPPQDRPAVSRSALSGAASRKETRSEFATALKHLPHWTGQPAYDIEEHVVRPSLLRLLAKLDVDGDQLTAEDLHAAFLLLLGACLMVADVVSGALWHVVSDRVAYEKVRAQTTDGELSVPAVDELLRFTASGRDMLLRFATEPLSIAGQAVETGDAVLLDTAAGNRDVSVFDAPSELRPDRALNRHLAFGRGSYNCLGAALARTHLAIAVGTLISRCGGLRLAPGADTAAWPDGWNGASPTRLEVNLG